MTKKSFLPIALMVLVWSGYFIASKYVVTLTGSPYLTGMLLRGAALFLYILIMCVSGELKDLFKTKHTWFLLLAIGSLGFLLDLFANIGFKYSSASIGTVLLKLDVLMVNLITAFILRKRLAKTDWLFSIFMLIGVIMVLNIDFRTLTFNYYDLFFIASALTVTINAFIIKWVQKKHNVGSNVIGFYNNFTVLVFFTLSSILTKDLFEFNFSAQGVSFPIIIILGGLMQCCIYIFYYYNLKRFEVWIVKVFLLFIPVVTSIVSIIIFDEILAPITIIGMLVVLLGAFGILINQKNKKENKNEDSNRI